MADAMIEKGLGPIEEVWGLETPLYYPELFAGTTDVVGLYNGVESIMDFKTAKTMRKRSEIGDYAAQLGAYAICHDERYGTDIKQGVILMVTRDLKFEAFIYDREQLRDGRQDFLRRVDSYYASV